jgi:predicted nucleic acid-binding protein
VLAPLWRGGPSVPLYRRALELAARFSLSFYDALIVAAALDSGCERLWSEDLLDGLRIDGLTIANPFAPAGEPRPPAKRRRRA